MRRRRKALRGAKTCRRRNEQAPRAKRIRAGAICAEPEARRAAALGPIPPQAKASRTQPTSDPKAGLKRAKRAFPPRIPAQSQCESMQNERRRIVFCRRAPCAGERGTARASFDAAQSCARRALGDRPQAGRGRREPEPSSGQARAKLGPSAKKAGAGGRAAQTDQAMGRRPPPRNRHEGQT